MKKSPCAGEHIEPDQKQDDRTQAILALNQEIGIPESTLSNCYIISLGTACVFCKAKATSAF